MVGDDLEADVLGAQRAGIAGVLVRTGKYTEKDEDGDEQERPRHVLDSVADLPALLGLSWGQGLGGGPAVTPTP